MDESDREAILRLWDEFAEDQYRYLDEPGEKVPLASRKRQREDRLPHIQDLITSFQAGDLPLFEFLEVLVATRFVCRRSTSVGLKSVADSPGPASTI